MFKAEFTVTDAEAGKRIDVLCAQKFSDLSRSRWQKHGKFKCNSNAKPAKTKSKTGDNWEVACAPETISDNLTPWNHPLKVLKESDSWVVIEKPYGIAVHPSISDTTQKTVVNALVHQFGQKLSENFDEIEGRQIPRPGLVHRLDKTTSGVMLIAKNNAAHKYFQTHWKDFSKHYQCIVQGKTPLSGKIESGIIRDPHNRQRMTAANSEKSKWSVTEFETVGDDNNRPVQSRLNVIIHTGRTHQIRVHLSSIGFSVIGDVLYGGPKADRVMLHAQKLTFTDPDNNDTEVLVESEVPF